MYDELGILLKRILSINFNRQLDEKVLFLTDIVPEDQKATIPPHKMELVTTRAKYAELLSIRAKSIIGEENVNLIFFPSTLRHGGEPSSFIEPYLLKSDIFLAITSYSITHTQLIQKAIKSGVRGASMPQISPGTFRKDGPLNINYQNMKELGDKYIQKIISLKKQVFPDSCHVKIIDAQKNELHFEILNEDNHFIRDYGICHEKGSFGNLPAGEIYIAPDSTHTANGKILIPAKYSKYCKSEEMEISFNNGRVSNIIGAKPVLLEYLGFIQGKKTPKTPEIKDSRRNLALFGLGLNKNAKNCINILESSKKLGACHFGLGTSATFGGDIQSDMHLGFVLQDFDLYINDTKFIKEGVPVFFV